MTELCASWIEPNWQPAPRVRALFSLRAGGCSQAPYDSLNLSYLVGDDPSAVRMNRAALFARAKLPPRIAWLRLTHGTRAVRAEYARLEEPADASYTQVPGVACVVTSADCLPVLVCDRDGTEVAAIHCGWRGLANNIIGKTLKLLRSSPSNLQAWIGPGISGAAFEVGGEVREAFLRVNQSVFADRAEVAFRAGREHHWYADLAYLADLSLRSAGVENIARADTSSSAGESAPNPGACTFAASDRFFSYRRDRVTGRMAAFIWLEPDG